MSREFRTDNLPPNQQEARFRSGCVAGFSLLLGLGMICYGMNTLVGGNERSYQIVGTGVIIVLVGLALTNHIYPLWKD